MEKLMNGERKRMPDPKNRSECVCSKPEVGNFPQELKTTYWLPITHGNVIAIKIFQLENGDD